MAGRGRGRGRERERWEGKRGSFIEWERDQVEIFVINDDNWGLWFLIVFVDIVDFFKGPQIWIFVFGNMINKIWIEKSLNSTDF